MGRAESFLNNLKKRKITATKRKETIYIVYNSSSAEVELRGDEAYISSLTGSSEEECETLLSMICDSLKEAGFKHLTITRDLDFIPREAVWRVMEKKKGWKFMEYYIDL